MATIFASMAKGKASQTTNPSLGGSSSTPPPTTFTSPPPLIPTPQQSIPIDMFKAEVDYAPNWDHDTDTLASFLALKSELHQTSATNDTTERLLEPICRFIHTEMTYQFAKQSVTVKIPGLKEMKERDLEMQKQISRLTNTVTRLAEQIAILSARPIPAAAPAAPRVVPALPQQRQKPPTTTKPPPRSCANLRTGSRKTTEGVYGGQEQEEGQKGDDPSEALRDGGQADNLQPHDCTQ